MVPWPVWVSGLSSVPCTKRSLVSFLIRAPRKGERKEREKGPQSVGKGECVGCGGNLRVLDQLLKCSWFQGLSQGLGWGLGGSHTGFSWPPSAFLCPQHTFTRCCLLLLPGTRVPSPCFCVFPRTPPPPVPGLRIHRWHRIRVSFFKSESALDILYLKKETVFLKEQPSGQKEDVLGTKEGSQLAWHGAQVRCVTTRFC